MDNKNNPNKSAKSLILIISAAVLLAVTVCLIVFIVSAALAEEPADNESRFQAASSQIEQFPASSEAEGAESDLPQYVTRGEYTLDAAYERLLLVNAENPLPEDFDYEGNLLTVEDKYINGTLKQIDKDIWPYMQAMIEAAWADGVELYIWSPYRSYSVQETLYQNQIKRCMDNGFDEEAAKAEAATVVARPGTSEHHTGLAVDFNMASDSFETTEIFGWLKENAADYGFIMRYSAQKQSITGVIHESWHWRFVGINTAKKINELDMCLEEYIDYINLE